MLGAEAATCSWLQADCRHNPLATHARDTLSLLASSCRHGRGCFAVLGLLLLLLLMLPYKDTVLFLTITTLT